MALDIEATSFDTSLASATGPEFGDLLDQLTFAIPDAPPVGYSFQSPIANATSDEVAAAATNVSDPLSQAALPAIEGMYNIISIVNWQNQFVNNPGTIPPDPEISGMDNIFAFLAIKSQLMAELAQKPPIVFPPITDVEVPVDGNLQYPTEDLLRDFPDWLPGPMPDAPLVGNATESVIPETSIPANGSITDTYVTAQNVTSQNTQVETGNANAAQDPASALWPTPDAGVITATNQDVLATPQITFATTSYIALETASSLDASDVDLAFVTVPAPEGPSTSAIMPALSGMENIMNYISWVNEVKTDPVNAPAMPTLEGMENIMAFAQALPQIRASLVPIDIADKVQVPVVPTAAVEDVTTLGTNAIALNLFGSKDIASPSSVPNMGNLQLALLRGSEWELGGSVEVKVVGISAAAGVSFALENGALKLNISVGLGLIPRPVIGQLVLEAIKFATNRTFDPAMVDRLVASAMEAIPGVEAQLGASLKLQFDFGAVTSAELSKVATDKDGAPEIFQKVKQFALGREVEQKKSADLQVIPLSFGVELSKSVGFGVGRFGVAGAQTAWLHQTVEFRPKIEGAGDARKVIYEMVAGSQSGPKIELGRSKKLSVEIQKIGFEGAYADTWSGEFQQRQSNKEPNLLAGGVPVSDLNYLFRDFYKADVLNAQALDQQISIISNWVNVHGNPSTLPVAALVKPVPTDNYDFLAYQIMRNPKLATDEAFLNYNDLLLESIPQLAFAAKGLISDAAQLREAERNKGGTGTFAVHALGEILKLTAIKSRDSVSGAIAVHVSEKLVLAPKLGIVRFQDPIAHEESKKRSPARPHLDSLDLAVINQTLSNFFSPGLITRTSQAKNLLNQHEEILGKLSMGIVQGSNILKNRVPRSGSTPTAVQWAGEVVGTLLTGSDAMFERIVDPATLKSTQNWIKSGRSLVSQLLKVTNELRSNHKFQMANVNNLGQSGEPTEALNFFKLDSRETYRQARLDDAIFQGHDAETALLKADEDVIQLSSTLGRAWGSINTSASIQDGSGSLGGAAFAAALGNKLVADARSELIASGDVDPSVEDVRVRVAPFAPLMAESLGFGDDIATNTRFGNPWSASRDAAFDAFLGSLGLDAQSKAGAWLEYTNHKGLQAQLSRDLKSGLQTVYNAFEAAMAADQSGMSLQSALESTGTSTQTSVQDALNRFESQLIDSVPFSLSSFLYEQVEALNYKRSLESIPELTTAQETQFALIFGQLRAINSTTSNDEVGRMAAKFFQPIGVSSLPENIAILSKLDPMVSEQDFKYAMSSIMKILDGTSIEDFEAGKVALKLDGGLASNVAPGNQVLRQILGGVATGEANSPARVKSLIESALKRVTTESGDTGQAILTNESQLTKFKSVFTAELQNPTSANPDKTIIGAYEAAVKAAKEDGDKPNYPVVGPDGAPPSLTLAPGWGYDGSMGRRTRFRDGNGGFFFLNSLPPFAVAYPSGGVGAKLWTSRFWDYGGKGIELVTETWVTVPSTYVDRGVRRPYDQQILSSFQYSRELILAAPTT
jgi:hypothetical protein